MTNKIRFHKMHGAGNDFALIDTTDQQFNPHTELIKSLADRHKGIGFDQLVLVNKSTCSDYDATYRFFNPDGSEAEQCGNGQRCIAHYLHGQNPNQFEFCISGLAGLMHSRINENKTVTINMGAVKSIKPININSKTCYQVDFGNPHLIHISNNIDEINLVQTNQSFSKSFSSGINFELVEIVNKSTINLRVSERGTGETMACGSGACATVAALQFAQLISDSVKVFLPGGILVVEYKHKDNNYYLTGPAEYVYSGVFTI